MKWICLLAALTLHPSLPASGTATQALHSRVLDLQLHPSRPARPSTENPPWFHFYRWLSVGDHRACRLQPTCSGFAVQAIAAAPPWQALSWGLARMQMEHSDQGGLLKASLGSDGRWIYSDPVARWAR